MRIVKPRMLREYGQQYPDAAAWLADWRDVVESADWRSIMDVRFVYPRADAATVKSGNQVTVFNVRGNRYRLIVSIKYQWGMVYVLRFWRIPNTAAAAGKSSYEHDKSQSDPSGVRQLSGHDSRVSSV